MEGKTRTGSFIKDMHWLASEIMSKDRFSCRAQSVEGKVSACIDWPLRSCWRMSELPPSLTFKEMTTKRSCKDIWLTLRWEEWEFHLAVGSVVCPTWHWRSTMFHKAIEYFLFAEAWRQVTDKVQDARAAARMKQLSYDGTLSFCWQQTQCQWHFTASMKIQKSNLDIYLLQNICSQWTQCSDILQQAWK